MSAQSAPVGFHPQIPSMAATRTDPHGKTWAAPSWAENDQQQTVSHDNPIPLGYSMNWLEMVVNNGMPLVNIVIDGYNGL